MTVEVTAGAAITLREADLAEMFGFRIRDDGSKEYGRVERNGGPPVWVGRAAQPATRSERHMWLALVVGEKGWPVEAPSGGK